jgi:TonB-linked SusC/RagA family outer membrane protein
LKVRFGWGQLGNERGSSEYPTYSVVIPGTEAWSSYYIFGQNQTGVLGLYPERMPNTLLHWETSEQTNLGIDLNAWENRISLTADYFIKTNKDIIMPLQLPEIGRGQQENPIANIGTIQNKGLELAIDFKNISGAFRYHAGMNFTTTKGNKIIDMAGSTIDGPNYQSLGVTTRTVEGRAMGLFYGYVCEGIFQSKEQILAHPTQNAVPGDLMFKDINGDRKITAEDRTYIGNPLPDFVYGINLGADYKGFDLSILFQGTYGNDILNLSRYETDFLAGDNYTNNFRTALLDSWTPANPSTTTPRLTMKDNNKNYRISSFYVEDGSYFRLKNIQLGYNLPAKWLRSIQIANVRVYVSGENLITITKYTGWDPEVGSTAAQAGNTFGTGYGLQTSGSSFAKDDDLPLSAVSRGIDMGVFPQARTFLFGVNITF